MILSKKVKITINPFTINYYRKLGYSVNKGSKLLIPIEQLQLSSNIIIIAKCDICNKKKKTKYKFYNNNINKHNIYACTYTCAKVKTRLTNITNRGCSNVSQDEKIKEQIRNTRTLKYGGVTFINKCNIIHSDKYDYSLTKYINKKSIVTVICKEHGEFKINPSMHLRGTGCPNCLGSNGEKRIRNILNNNNVKFIEQYKFNDCKNIIPLRFDFYLPDFNLLIEFNGKQHYHINSFFGQNIKTFKEARKRDNIKINYCKKNNIRLLIIKYNSNITKILNKYGINN